LIVQQFVFHWTGIFFAGTWEPPSGQFSVEFPLNLNQTIDVVTQGLQENGIMIKWDFHHDFHPFSWVETEGPLEDMG